VHYLIPFLLKAASLWKTEEKCIDPAEFRAKPANSRNKCARASEPGFREGKPCLAAMLSSGFTYFLPEKTDAEQLGISHGALCGPM
jgi:hypothetical protein